MTISEFGYYLVFYGSIIAFGSLGWRYYSLYFKQLKLIDKQVELGARIAKLKEKGIL